jgi:hypothetical protein
MSNWIEKGVEDAIIRFPLQRVRLSSASNQSAGDRTVALLLALRFFWTGDRKHLPASRVVILQPSSPEDIALRIARRSRVATTCRLCG